MGNHPSALIYLSGMGYRKEEGPGGIDHPSAFIYTVALGVEKNKEGGELRVYCRFILISIHFLWKVVSMGSSRSSRRAV